MRPDGSAIKVGLTVAAGLVVLAIGILMVGEQNFLFTPTQSYFVRFANVVGLAEDNPVQLSGVSVGKVAQIVLPEDNESQRLQVWLKVERRYASRIREDSVAKIKTLGLLGDKYVALTSGSSGSPQIENGGEIEADEPTDVDALIQSGEDVVDNIVTTARSLSVILNRMERGEGLLGELATEREQGSLTESVERTLGSVERIAQRIESGEGTLGKLLTDPSLAESLASSLERVAGLLDDFDQGEGLLPALIHDGQSKDRFDQLMARAEESLSQVTALVAELESGEGLLPRLIHDQELGENISGELEELLERLNGVVDKVTTGDGTAAQLINDPAIYQALNDIVVGIDESKLLRWLIRNRQKKGIKKRYQEELKAEEASAGTGNGL